MKKQPLVLSFLLELYLLLLAFQISGKHYAVIKYPTRRYFSAYTYFFRSTTWKMKISFGKLFLMWTTTAVLLLASIGGVFVHAQDSGGEIEAVDMVTGGCGHCTYPNGPTGWGFTPTVNIEVTHLGIFDESETLFFENPTTVIKIGLFDSTGSILLTSTDLTAQNSVLSGDAVVLPDKNGGPGSGRFRYVQLPVPQMLNGGETYFVVNGAHPGRYAYLKNYNYSVGPDIVLGQGKIGGAVAGTPFYFPPNNYALTLMGPNFKYTVQSQVSPPVANAGPDQMGTVGVASVLSGDASYDPNQEYPLSYEWTLVSSPEGSLANIVDATSPMATIVPDVVGDYIVELTVTNAHGIASLPSSTTIGTANIRPVADAGPDQEVQAAGTLVQLDGSASWDYNGDPLTYSWQLVVPTGSAATLSDPTSSSPAFLADLYGSYEAVLEVNDGLSTSFSDTTVITFENLSPNAEVGGEQAVLQGDTVLLDGTGSSDPNGDTLSYMWSIVSAPPGSTATIVSPSSVTTSLVVNVPGLFVVELLVNDGELSDTENMNIYVTSYVDELIDTLHALLNDINGLPNGHLKNKNMVKTLGNKVNSVISKVAAGDYIDGHDQLTHDIRKKTDGCSSSGGGSPDNNDWILDCSSQALIEGHIQTAIDLLENIFII